MACPRPGEQCQEYYCGGNASGKCASGKNADIQEMIAEHDRALRAKIIEEIFDVLRNPLNIDAIAHKDRIMVDAILKRQYEQFIS